MAVRQLLHLPRVTVRIHLHLLRAVIQERLLLHPAVIQAHLRLHRAEITVQALLHPPLAVTTAPVRLHLLPAEQATVHRHLHRETTEAMIRMAVKTATDLRSR